MVATPASPASGSARRTTTKRSTKRHTDLPTYSPKAAPGHRPPPPPPSPTRFTRQEEEVSIRAMLRIQRHLADEVVQCRYLLAALRPFLADPDEAGLANLTGALRLLDQFYVNVAPEEVRP